MDKKKIEEIKIKFEKLQQLYDIKDHIKDGIVRSLKFYLPPFGVYECEYGDRENRLRDFIVKEVDEQIEELEKELDEL